MGYEPSEDDLTPLPRHDFVPVLDVPLPVHPTQFRAGFRILLAFQLP